jgi:hypothetical protein
MKKAHPVGGIAHRSEPRVCWGWFPPANRSSAYRNLRHGDIRPVAAVCRGIITRAAINEKSRQPALLRQSSGPSLRTVTARPKIAVALCCDNFHDRRQEILQRTRLPRRGHSLRHGANEWYLRMPAFGWLRCVNRLKLFPLALQCAPK